MTQPVINVAVTGAAGQIGYALLFRIASGQAFGHDQPINLQLLEVEPALGALKGVAMELEDCAFPLLRNIHVTADPNQAMQDVNYAVLVGAAPRKAGMERADLLAKNGGIFKEQGQALNNHAADNVRVFVVGNPCNTNALITMHHAPDVPRDRFYAMTMLDENRARSQLAIRAEVPVEVVSCVPIWGNHSATQFPDFYHATIHDKPVCEVIDDIAWLQSDFISTVQKRGAAVIEARGASSAASAANAVVDSLFALSHDTAKADMYSIARCSQGEYGVDPGLIFSFPCRTIKQHVEVVSGLQFDEFAQQQFNVTLNELRQEQAAVQELGLI